MSYLKKGLAVLLALVFVFAILPTAALAEDVTIYENTYANAPALSAGQTVKIGNGPVVASSYVDFYNADMKYKVNITQPSVLTVSLSTTATTSGQRTNSMRMDLMQDDTQHLVHPVKVNGQYGYFYSMTVYSNAMPLKKTIVYKVMPGTYYLHADCRSALNALAWLKVDSIVPVGPDAFGEPNDSTAQAKTIQVNTQYAGNIKYANLSGLGHNDAYDYYKLKLPAGAKSLKLWASRADTDRNNDTKVLLTNASGYGLVSGGGINLDSTPSGSYTYTNLPAGTYYVLINATSAVAYPTEYQFRVEAPTVKAGKVKLNKKTLTLKKGKKASLKATISPKNTTNKKLKWSSSKPKIASVTQKGVVKGLKKGKATITVKTVNGKKATCKVQVK